MFHSAVQRPRRMIVLQKWLVMLATLGHLSQTSASSTKFEKFNGVFEAGVLKVVSDTWSMIECARGCVEEHQCGAITSPRDSGCKLQDALNVTGLDLFSSDAAFWLPFQEDLSFPSSMVEITDGVDVGQVFRISGTPTQATEFKISLGINDSYVPLRISSYFVKQNSEGEQLYMSTRTNGSWSVKNVLRSSGSFPFQVDVVFQLMVLVTSEQLMVYVDGLFYGERDHPGQDHLANIRYLDVEGDVIVQRITF